MKKMKHQEANSYKTIGSSEVRLRNKGRELIYHLDNPVPFLGKAVIQDNQSFQRHYNELSNQNVDIIVDQFGDGSVCEFIRFHVEEYDKLILNLSGIYEMIMKQETGMLFRGRSSEAHHYWIPISPVARIFDKFGRILKENVLSSIECMVQQHSVHASFTVPKGMTSIDIVAWHFPLNSPILEQLSLLLPIEQQNIFLWGSHTQYNGPKDIYNCLIHGIMYEDRWSWAHHKWKSFSEIDAHALYVGMHSLWRATGKQIYQHLKTQIVFSVITSQDKDGAWRQGLCAEYIEEHYRYQCSGINLLLSAYEETGDTVIGSALQKAVDYLREQCEELKVGTWYLHDSLEKSIDEIRKGPMKFAASRSLGKTSSNMLVLNTHLDALVSLCRYSEKTTQQSLCEEIESGRKAALSVLNLKPAGLLYRLLFRMIGLTLMPATTAKKLPLQTRAVRRLTRQWLIKLLPEIKKIFPRLVMPNGYIDRDLSIRFFNPAYHVINVMDLLRFQRYLNEQIVDTILDNAIELAVRLNLIKKLLEDGHTQYAAGFWAEAMYLECLRRPERNRSMLANAVIHILNSGQGLPPSLFGCNPEYVPLSKQMSCIWTENNQISVVNLSIDPEHIEYLLVNRTNCFQETKISHWEDDWEMFDQNNKRISFERTISIRPLSWITISNSERNIK